MDNGDNNIKIDKVVKICVSDESVDSKVRLDSFLYEIYPDYSRSYFQKLIKQGFVLVNNKSVNKSFCISPRDEIEVKFGKVKSLCVGPIEVDFDIVSMEKDFIVINKPAGLTVHHSKDICKEPTLVHGLLYRFKEFEDFIDDDRPGIVHRLDRYTSGLIIVARNIIGHIALANLFKDRKIEKSYLAVVKGHPDKDGKIDFAIGRHPVDRKKMSHVSYSGKRALTYYNVLKYYKDEALVRVRIITGRTHQIRVHFAAIGHGLLGDDIYGVKSKLIKRQALHSYELSFEYKRKKYFYKVDYPDDFKKLLKNLEPVEN